MSTTDHIEFQAQINKRPNPFIEHIDDKRIQWKKIGIWTLAIFALLIIILEIGVFRNKHFYVHLVIFSGNTHLDDAALAQELNRVTQGSRLAGLIPKRNILFLQRSTIKKAFYDRFGITNLSLDTIISQQAIHISLQEAPIAYHLQRNDDLLNVTQDGHILSSGVKIPQNLEPQTKYESLTIKFTDQTPQILSLVQLPKELMARVASINAAAQEIQNTVILSSLQMANPDSTDVQCQTAKGWYIRIDTTGNIQTEIQNAQRVFSEKIQNTSKEAGLQYIDARIPDRVYYK